MRKMASIVLAFAALGAAPALAGDGAPEIVIPGKAGVPVIINGFDASGAVVEGDWGLYRPGGVSPTIISRPLAIPSPYTYGGYYPAFGRRPGYGRLEVVPPANRRLPRPAQSFHRSWTTQSDPLPATIDPPAAQPPIVVAPQIEPRRRTSSQHHP